MNRKYTIELSEEERQHLEKNNLLWDCLGPNGETSADIAQIG